MKVKELVGVQQTLCYERAFVALISECTDLVNLMQNWVKYFRVEARLSLMMGTFCLMCMITEVTYGLWSPTCSTLCHGICTNIHKVNFKASINPEDTAKRYCELKLKLLKTEISGKKYISKYYMKNTK